MGLELHVASDKTVCHQIIYSVISLVFYIVGAIIIKLVVMDFIIESENIRKFCIAAKSIKS